KRGPEGAIIDYFKANPEAAKSFGWDGKVDLIEWAGKKAHSLWLEDAEEALAKPETLEQLKELGYSPDAEGYAQMIRRIGKGFVELDPKTGKINLVDTEYLKARVPSEVVSGVAPKAPPAPPEAPPGVSPTAPPSEAPPRVPPSEVSPEVSPEVPPSEAPPRVPPSEVSPEIPPVVPPSEAPPEVPPEVSPEVPPEEPPKVPPGELPEKTLPDEEPPKVPPGELPEKTLSGDITNIVTKEIGFTEGEYNAIKGITVEKLLKEIPFDKNKAWAIWRGDIEGESIDLPHHGAYWFTEFKKHIKLAELIRASKPSSEQLKLTIEEYLKNYLGEKAP
ncbi:MAG: hypothetical protein QME57_04455, partial [Patescibacteria group bacterium]|nr:hypothetical protein [Patescibacteria group bacterium]